MSNILPLAVCVPLPLLAYAFDLQGKLLISIVLWACTPVALWVSINCLALFQNKQLKAALLKKLQAVRNDQVGIAVFVGFSRPLTSSGIHLHEDVGWLILDPDSVSFLGERGEYKIPKQEIKRARFAFNWNSILGLGRWIIIEGIENGKRIQLRVEPRERSTMLANLLFGKLLLKQIQAWQKSAR